jgi:hypothetical protein
MDTLLRLAPVLGCLAMGAMMWLMMRGQHHSAQQPSDPHTQEEINRLRAEITLLKQDRLAHRDDGQPGTQTSA